MTAEVQRENVRLAARSLAPLAERFRLVLSHGNGPQVGLLALQAACYHEVEPYPLDVLGAQTEGMIGYLIEQEMRNHLPAEIPLATILTMVEVDPSDPAFRDPSKFVGPIYTRQEADRVSSEKGWVVRQDGASWRRVVPSPVPRKILEIRPIRWLLAEGTVVICTGGGGIPTAIDRGILSGVEAVIDKDMASALLARELEAGFFVMATDVPGVFLDWGTPRARMLRRARVEELRKHRFAPGSMGPKVEAACEFVEKTGKPAAIGSLTDLEAIIAGTAGTLIES